MKRKTIGFVIILSIIFLLSSCDISTLLENFKGNAYEDVFDMDLVGEQAQESVDSVVEASEPDRTSAGDAIDSTDTDNKKVKVDKVETVGALKGVTPPNDIPADDVSDKSDLNDGEVAIVDNSVPTLPKQDDDEKDKLKKAVAQALAGEGEDDFVEGLKEEADDDQVFAAHNTKIIVKGVLEKLKDAINSSSLSDDMKNVIINFVDKLQFNLPSNPTKADILNVQLANNIANSMIDVLNAIAGDGDIADLSDSDIDANDESVKEALRKLASDAGFLIKVSKAQGSTSALINSIDVNGLFDAFDDSPRTSKSIQGSSEEIPDDTIDMLNKFKKTINLLLKDILGVDIEANTPTMDYDAFLDAIDSYKLQLSAFETFISAAKVGDYDYDDVNADERSEFCGITGSLNYTIATVLVNLEGALDEIEELLNNPTYNSVEAIVNEFLDVNKALINPEDGYDYGMEAKIPDDFASLETTFDEIDDVLNQLDLEDVAIEYVENIKLLAELGTPVGDKNVLLDMFNEIELPTNSSE